MLAVITACTQDQHPDADFRPVTRFLNSRKDCGPLASVAGLAEGWEDPGPRSKKGWLSQKSFCQTERKQTEELFGKCVISYFFLPSILPPRSAPPPSYLSTPQNSGLPGRCQGSWEPSCEMMRNQAKVLLFDAIHSIVSN